MARVIGIKQVRYLDVPVEDEPKHGPVTTVRTRMVLDLPENVFRELLSRPRVLPLHTGAGPCGTNARGPIERSWLAWSVRHLVEPLRAYYETYRKPLQFGAKQGPRGRRATERA